jgi:hypothetical protein
MKIFGFKPALAMLTSSTMSLFFQAPSQAQVKKQLLSDVIKSCHKDMNVEYFTRMGFSSDMALYRTNERNILDSRSSCVYYRYKHLSLIEQTTWLPYSGEIISGYSASVAISSVLSKSHPSSGEQILSCFADQNPNSQDCISSFSSEVISRVSGHGNVMLPYICPKCLVAVNDASSFEINRGAINWFLSLDKPKRREIASMLTSQTIRDDLERKASNAANTYQEALRKLEQDDKEQRRRNLLSQ